jgi:hypothetical protein
MTSGERSDDMRKLMVASFVSLDGAVEAPMTWTGSYFDDGCKEYASEKLRDVDLFLLGRITYGMFSALVAGQRWQIHRAYQRAEEAGGLKNPEGG